jgi:uncharacterized protein YegL
LFNNAKTTSLFFIRHFGFNEWRTNSGIKQCFKWYDNSLRSDAQASETLWISIITFNSTVTELVPLTELPSFQLPEITNPIGATFTGKALEELHNKSKQDIRKGNANQKGDWKPLLFLITDGKPSDTMLYSEMIPKIKKLNFGVIVGCAVGGLADDSN